MKIAFLGKGGSGKSTLSVAAVQHALARGMNVLAVDADHNMDMTYGLGIESPSVFLGTDSSLIKRYIGAPETISFAEARLFARDRSVSFSAFPADAFTDSVSILRDRNLRMMTAGPHTDIVRSGEHCSHSLAAPLKVYLPLLKVRDNELVVIDERAGTDPVATGILSGIDMAFIVAEPTVQSIRVATQIATELDIASVRYEFIANKYRNNDHLYDAAGISTAIRVPHTGDPRDFTDALGRALSLHRAVM